MKLEPAAGAAVSVSTAPGSTTVAHVAPQVMPAGLLLTVPAPEPFLARVSVGRAVNVAVTAVLPDSVVAHGPVPEHPPPDQPLNTDPASGVAVRTTSVPSSYVAEHVAPQLMPPGPLVTDPPPVPAFVTANVEVATNTAPTAVSAFSVNAHAPVPPHPAPDQPANRLPGDGTAVRVTAAPWSPV